MKRAFVIILGVGAFLVLAASALAQDAKTTKAMDIFVKQKCTTCHSIAGRGSKKGPLDDVGGKLTAAQIREWLVDPVGMAAKTQPPPTRKPPMKKKALSADEIDALVAYLSTLKG
ncbi:MAG: cytochrome c [Vicinamibacterales bacterium]|jgi:mono/diheme cytochrome c family protein